VQTALDQRALDDLGLAPDTVVTWPGQKMKAGQALRHALGQAGLAWRVSNETLMITTSDEASIQLEARVYPVRDLAADATDLDRLMSLISGSVDPDQWTEVGGPGAAAALPGAGILAVSQNAEVHGKIEDLLAQLRRQDAATPQDNAAQAPADAQTLKLVIYPLRTAPSPAVRVQLEQQGEAKPALPVGDAAAPRGDVLSQFGGLGGELPGAAAEAVIPGDDLVELVINLIEPESWSREGVLIKAVPGRLVIRQTAAVHRQVEKLLTQLDASPIPGGNLGGFGGGFF
jgi:hypothetical protein